MRKGFELNGDYRLMSSSELIYILTNSAILVNKVQEKEILYGEECYFEDILSKMTPGKRHLLMAGVELYKRCNSRRNERPQIKSSVDIYDLMQPIIGDNRTEEAWAIFINANNRVIRKIRISSGGYNCCIVDIKVLLKEAILSESAALFVCHNHPSGNNKPSLEDDRLTQKIKEAATSVDIKLLDHIIICNDSYFSYADEGRI